LTTISETTTTTNNNKTVGTNNNGAIRIHNKETTTTTITTTATTTTTTCLGEEMIMSTPPESGTTPISMKIIVKEIITIKTKTTATIGEMNNNLNTKIPVLIAVIQTTIPPEISTAATMRKCKIGAMILNGRMTNTKIQTNNQIGIKEIQTAVGETMNLKIRMKSNLGEEATIPTETTITMIESKNKKIDPIPILLFSFFFFFFFVNIDRKKKK